MLKRFFWLFPLLCVLITACGAEKEPQHMPAEDSSGTADSIVIGMTVDEMESVLQSQGVELIMPEYDEELLAEELQDMPRDGRMYNLTDYSFYFRAENGGTYTFSYEGVLCSISAFDSTLATAEGVKAGDSVEKMESIYGTGYDKDVEDYQVYRYEIDGVYLMFFYEDDFITGWRLSAYPNINND